MLEHQDAESAQKWAESLGSPLPEDPVTGSVDDEEFDDSFSQIR